MEILEEYELSYAIISTGDCIRDYIESNMAYSEDIRLINDLGKLTPDFIAEAFVLRRILNLAKKVDVIILNGGPRRVKDADRLFIWKKSGFFGGAIKTIEVISPYDLCFNRLIERTKEDCRLDLSIDGQPGVPDPKKIKRKMAWWTRAESKIRQKLIQHDLYLTPVYNNGKLEQLKDNLYKLFA